MLHYGWSVGERAVMWLAFFPPVCFFPTGRFRFALADDTKSVVLHIIAKTLGQCMTMNSASIYEIVHYVEMNIFYCGLQKEKSLSYWFYTGQKPKKNSSFLQSWRRTLGKKITWCSKHTRRSFLHGLPPPPWEKRRGSEVFETGGR